jgi:hypothetical protein
LALTRARHRLFLVADAGTLQRRSQWEQAVDDLDETAAGLERDLVARLVLYLLGQGRHQAAFRLSEGGGA